jgi:hypothetical protein
LRVGAAQDGDLVAQHEELDVLGGGGASEQKDQSKHLPEDQVQQTQRHAGIMSDRRSPLVSAPGPTFDTPQVSDIDVTWQLSVTADGTAVSVNVELPEAEAHRLDGQREMIAASLQALADLAETAT